MTDEWLQKKGIICYRVDNILAVLNYVSRAHEIAISPSSVRVAIISEPFEFFFYEYFLFSLTSDPSSENVKTLLLLQIAAESFQTFPEFSSKWFSQNYVWDL